MSTVTMGLRGEELPYTFISSSVMILLLVTEHFCAVAVHLHTNPLGNNYSISISFLPSFTL
jgi:hypothetical protein